MAGLLRVEWKLDGETVKDELIPHFLEGVETVGDLIVVNGHNLEVCFQFDPALHAPEADSIDGD